MNKYIVFALLAILCIFIIVSNVRYSKLKKEYLTLQLEQPTQFDSLKFENQQLNDKILKLESTIDLYSYRIDSLYKVKQKIVIETIFKESENLSDGVKVLKYNLQCEK